MEDDTSLTYLNKTSQIIHFGLSGEEWACNELLETAITGGVELLEAASLHALGKCGTVLL